MKFCCSAVVVLIFSYARLSADQPVVIELYPDVPATEQATVTVYHPKTPSGISVLICPGGGYGGLAIEPEGHGIARWLNQHDITGIVLQYRMPKGRCQIPLSDARQALQTIRSNARAWQLNRQQIGVIGFSAGGHLASTLATHTRNRRDRPAFAILIYPVITMGDKGHAGSRRNLLGDQPSERLITTFSNELQVSQRTPPTFLAHAVDDRVVPSINSEMFHRACIQAGVPSRYLELESGDHGFHGYQGPSWDAWQRESLPWVKEQFNNRSSQRRQK
ncbi:MAG: alpha/beta hydrolase [Planctomycetota bacterium]|nr:alpha/beta hydrolase [Planctomycetota bacterium]